MGNSFEDITINIIVNDAHVCLLFYIVFFYAARVSIQFNLAPKSMP